MVQIQIVTWNSRKFLPYCFESLQKQTYNDFGVLIIDNASTDGTIEYIKQFPTFQIVRNTSNKGFSYAHNQGFALAKNCSHALIMNPDIILEPTFLEELMRAIESESNVGSVSGALMRAHFGDEEINEVLKTKTYDTCGLEVGFPHRFYNVDDPLVCGAHKKEEVFGLSGALCLFNLSALRRSAVSYTKNGREYQEIFDEDFFAYKEDIDIAWRMKLFGFRALYMPSAVAYHFRSVKQKRNIFDLSRDHRSRSFLINYLSYRNHIWMLIKNEHAVNLFLYAPLIILEEIGKFLYLLFFNPKVLIAWISITRKIPLMMRKRQQVMQHALLSAREIRRWL